MYINRKDGTLVEAEEIRPGGWWVYDKNGKFIRSYTTTIFQEQYGEAMICQKAQKGECKAALHPANRCPHKDIHICTDSCMMELIHCPNCIPYIPEQKEWWLKYKCSQCKNFSPDCRYIEKKTLKETGDSPACSLYIPGQKLTRKEILALSVEERRPILEKQAEQFNKEHPEYYKEKPIEQSNLMLSDDEIEAFVKEMGWNDTPAHITDIVCQFKTFQGRLLDHLKGLGIVFIKIKECPYRREKTNEACRNHKIECDARPSCFEEYIPLSDYKGQL